MLITCKQFTFVSVALEPHKIEPFTVSQMLLCEGVLHCTVLILCVLAFQQGCIRERLPNRILSLFVTVIQKSSKVCIVSVAYAHVSDWKGPLFSVYIIYFTFLTQVSSYVLYQDCWSNITSASRDSYVACLRRLFTCNNGTNIREADAASDKLWTSNEGQHTVSEIWGTMLVTKLINA